MQGSFFWYDVMTTDTTAAEKFYRTVVGWGTVESGNPDYTLFSVGDRGVAGLMAIPEDARKAGARPAWMGYIYVEDVDAMAARIVEQGGKLMRPPVDVPGTIRFAVMADPHGAGFLIAKPMRSDAPPPLAQGTPGTIGWRELYAGDGAAAFAFYEKLFGWKKTESFDMGAMGIYQLFATGDGAGGGIMTKPADMPAPPHWGYYFYVDAIDAAAARVTSGGGKIVMGPHQVPTGEWIVQCIDPQGAACAFLAPKR